MYFPNFSNAGWLQTDGGFGIGDASVSLGVRDPNTSNADITIDFGFWGELQPVPPTTVAPPTTAAPATTSVAEAENEVAVAADEEELAFTGTGTNALALTGAVAIGLGGLVLLQIRRRRLQPVLLR